MVRFARLLPFALALFLVGAWATPASAEPVALVPHVVGLDVDEALDRLAALGFEAQVTWIADGAPGRVTEQHPHRGARAELGATVQIVAVQRVRIETKVPDVRGLPEAEALAALEPVYALEVVEVASSPEQDGRVLAQDPVPGRTLPFRGALQITVGRAGLASEVVVVPALEGLDLAEAEARLLETGLVPIPAFRRANARPFAVLAQDRRAGDAVRPGEHVHLEVALPAGFPRKIRVPSLIGATPEEALGALRALGLNARATRVPSVFEEDTVVRQIPAAGTNAFVGSQAHVVIAFPAARTHIPAQVVVPGLRGVPLTEVWVRARATGIRLEIRRTLAPEHAPETVIRQRPTPGVRVPLGTVVRVDLPVVAEVPSLLGLAPAAAAERAAGDGFAVVFEGDARHGRQVRVVDQRPSPGELLSTGSVLRLVLRGRGFPSPRPPADTVLMPDARGRTVSNARALLEGAGLQATVTGPPFVDPRVTEIVGQDPAPGSRLARGARVRLVYRLKAAAGPGASVRVPDLTGLSLTNAQRALLDAGLLARPSVVRGGGPPGVTGQSPAPGTVVQRGTEVRFTYRRR